MKKAVNKGMEQSQPATNGSTRPTVYVAQPLDDQVVNRLAPLVNVVLGYGPTAVPLDDVIHRIDGLIVRNLRVTEDLLRRATRLRAVVRAGTGMDTVDLQTAAELGIPIVNTGTANVFSVAEQTVALALASARSLVAWDKSARARGVAGRTENPGTELYGKVWGIVGFGNIGQRVAAIAHRGLAMNVLAYVPSSRATLPDQVEGVEFTRDLLDCLTRSDVVSLHVPLTDETRGMIGAAQLAAMKPSAILVNIARGGVVDSTALLESLKAGRPGRAAVDVFAPEFPQPPFELYGIDAVTISPHRGSRTVESEERTGATATDELIRLLGLSEHTAAPGALTAPMSNR